MTGEFNNLCLIGMASNKNKVSTDPAKEEKIKKAQELAGNAKPGSLTAKANLVSRYNKGQKTEEGSK